MKRPLLAVTAQPDSGKTTTIRDAYAVLVERGWEQIEKGRGRAKIGIDSGEYLGAKLKLNENVIGFVSAGDSEDRMRPHLERLANDDSCDIFVCGCRHKGTNPFAFVETLGERFDIKRLVLDRIDNDAWDRMTPADQLEIRRERSDKLLEAIDEEVERLNSAVA
jgi:hypothetical protein